MKTLLDVVLYISVLCVLVGIGLFALGVSLKFHEQRQRVMASMISREDLLERLVLHLSLCANCQTTLNVGQGGPLCVNGERLWLAARMGELPKELPPEWGPADLPNTFTKWRPGPLVPPNETH